MTAIREVNQIIGRCIRHQNDYASIFLIDERYDKHNIKDKLSKWIKERLRTFPKFEELEDDLKTFFRENEIRTYQKEEEERMRMMNRPVKPLSEMAPFQISAKSQHPKNRPEKSDV